MASNFNRDNYKKIFEQRFGSGSYESGLAKAREIGRLKVQADVARKDYNSRMSEARKQAKKAAARNSPENSWANDVVESFRKEQQNKEFQKQSDSSLRNPKAKEGQGSAGESYWASKGVPVGHGSSKPYQSSAPKDNAYKNPYSRSDLKDALEILRKNEDEEALDSFARKFNSLSSAGKDVGDSLSAYDKTKKYTDKYWKPGGYVPKGASRDINGNIQSDGYDETIEERKWDFQMDPVVNKKHEAWLAAQKKDEPKKPKKPGFLSDVGAAGKAAFQFFNPFDDVSMKEAAENFMNRKPTDQFNEIARGANRAVDSASLGAMSNLDKKLNDRDPYYTEMRKFGEGGGTDMITSGLGYIVPGVGAYKALNATKAGKALTQFGSKGVGQRLASEAAKGSIAGGAMSSAEVGVREGLNPDDYNWKQNAGLVGLGVAGGAIADPLLYGAGKGIGKGFEKTSENVMKGLLPSNKGTADAISSVISKADQLKPKTYTMPDGKEIRFKNQADSILKNAELKAESIRPEAEQYTREFEDAVRQQYEYLKNSMGKGVDTGTTSNGLAGNNREVSGRYTVSNNPKWYQDFYAQHGRKPSDKELRQLAEQHVREGFEDEVGSLPPWQPSKVQQIDDEIEQILNILREQPEQEAALRPILQALEEDKAIVMQSAESVGQYQNLSREAEAIRQSLNAPKQVASAAERIAPGRDFEPITQGSEPPLARVSDALLDTQRQATGNIDSFRARVDRTPKKKDGGLLSGLRTQFIDDVAPLETLEKQITGNVGSAENSLYKQARLFKGSPEKAHLIVKEQLQPIIRDLQRSKLKMDDLADYSLAVHAKDVNEKGINSGFTNAEIEDVIAKLGSEEMEAARKKLIGANNNVLDLLSNGGIISKADVQVMKEKWPNYVSLFRAFDDDKIEFASGISKAMSNASNPIKKLEGSNRAVIDPMESVVKNIFKATNTVDRNNVAKQIGKLAEQDTEGNFIKRLADNEDASRKNVISVLEDGKKVKYEVPPEVYSTMMNLDKESTNTLIKILQKPASTLRAGATLTPEFSLRNPLRDVPNAFVVSESGFNPVVDFPVGLWQSIWKGRTIKIGNKEFKTSGELYKQFVKENGGYGNIISMDRELHRQTLKKALTDANTDYVDVLNPKTYAAVIKKFANPLNALRTIADVSETATKVGEFRAATRKGVSPQEAAYRARDIMDFARAGVSIREANKVVAFLNANIQGKSKLFRAFKQNPAKVTGRAVAAVSIPAIGAIVAQNTYANEKQREILDDSPQWLKDTFFLVPIPGTNQIARIPKPFDLAYPFANTLERAFDFVAKNDKEAFDGFIKQAFSAASVPVMLTGLAPIVEGMANYSFFRQGPVIPKREENMNFPDQYDVNTTETAKFIAKGVNKATGGEGAFKNFGSPRIIDNTVQGFTGGLGTYATSAIDWFVDATGAVNKPERPAKNLDQKPLARAFLVNQSSGGESLDTIYSLKEKLTKERGSAKQNNAPFKDEVKYKTVNEMTKQLSEVNKQIRFIENNPSLSAEQKRSMLNDLIRQRNTFARKAAEQTKGWK